MQVQELEKQLPFDKAPAAFISHLTDGFPPNLTQGIHTSYCFLGKHVSLPVAHETITQEFIQVLSKERLYFFW